MRLSLRNMNLPPTADASVCAQPIPILAKRPADVKVGPSLNAYHDIQYLYGALPREPVSSAIPAECLLVIDSGYSHTTVTPFYKGRPLQPAIRRLWRKVPDELPQRACLDPSLQYAG